MQQKQEFVSGWDQGREHWPRWHDTQRFMPESVERVLAPLGYFDGGLNLTTNFGDEDDVQ